MTQAEVHESSTEINAQKEGNRPFPNSLSATLSKWLRVFVQNLSYKKWVWFAWKWACRRKAISQRLKTTREWPSYAIFKRKGTVVFGSLIEKTILTSVCCYRVNYHFSFFFISLCIQYLDFAPLNIALGSRLMKSLVNDTWLAHQRITYTLNQNYPANRRGLTDILIVKVIVVKPPREGQ